MLLLSREKVTVFHNQNLSGRQRRKAPVWHEFKQGEIHLLAMVITAKIRDGFHALLQEKLLQERKEQMHKFSITVARSIMEADGCLKIVLVYSYAEYEKCDSAYLKRKRLKQR